jgi:hypothetical protein
MRLPLSNGLYIDPCNPTLLHDSPNEPQGEIIKLSQAEKDRMELEKKIERLHTDIEQLTIKDYHFD